MIYESLYSSTNMAITNIRAMLMTSGDYAEYVYRKFPFELNHLVSINILYPSLVMEIWLMQMPIKTTSSRCLVLNALVAFWPDKHEDTEVAVIEYRSIQKAYNIEPDITQCKKILLALIRDKWGVTFKGKELITCS